MKAKKEERKGTEERGRRSSRGENIKRKLRKKEREMQCE